MMKPITISFLILFALIQPSLATPVEQLEGVQFKRYVAIKENQLTLQGVGLLRYMVFIKAYVGAFYLPDVASTEDVLGPVVKRLELEYFHAIKKEDFAKATRQKIADNVDEDQMLRLQSRIEQFSSLYRDVQPGDRYTLSFLPGIGTELALNGEALGVIPGDDFARAVFAIWLGADPIDRKFRDLLLGDA